MKERERTCTKRVLSVATNLVLSSSSSFNFLCALPLPCISMPGFHSFFFHFHLLVLDRSKEKVEREREGRECRRQLSKKKGCRWLCQYFGHTGRKIESHSTRRQEIQTTALIVDLLKVYCTQNRK